MRQNQLLKHFVPIAMVCAIILPCEAQETPPGCVEWKSYTDTVWVEQNVTENRVISETSYETKEVTKSRPRWISEERERTITEEKPVVQTTEKVVTRKVRRPVTTRKTRTRTRVIESYEDVTEMREENYTVRKPVTETTYEKKEVLVRKPVTKRGVEKEEVTVYRPKETTQTTMVPGTLMMPGQTSSRTRMRWLERGYYSDPYSGNPVWRRSGLHWVNEPTYGQNAVPVVVPQQQSSTTMVPETLVVEKPFERTTYVDEYESREVPVEVERIVEETRTRKVPFTVRVPKRKVIEEEIPYTETTYVEEEITERIPVTETVMKKVTRTEPYTRIRESWEDYTETVKVPTTTTKQIPYVSKYRVPYLVEVRVPCDANGNPVARGQQVPGTHRLHPSWRKMITKVSNAKETIQETAGSSVLETPAESPAQFDVPDAKSVLSKESRSKSDSPGDPPENLRFRNGTRKETSTRMKTIVRADAEPPKPTGPQETAASKKLNEELDAKFRRMGFMPANSDADSEAEKLVETSRRDGTSVDKNLLPEPTQAPFDPEPLSVEVQLPPEAVSPAANNSAQPDAVDKDDDTIERPVDLSRPERS